MECFASRLKKLEERIAFFNSNRASGARFAWWHPLAVFVFCDGDGSDSDFGMGGGGQTNVAAVKAEVTIVMVDGVGDSDFGASESAEDICRDLVRALRENACMLGTRGGWRRGQPTRRRRSRSHIVEVKGAKEIARGAQMATVAEVVGGDGRGDGGGDGGGGEGGDGGRR